MIFLRTRKIILFQKYKNVFCTFSGGLFSASFLLFSELDLLLLLLLLEDEELEEDFESCLLKLSFDTDPLDTSISWGYTIIMQDT